MATTLLNPTIWLVVAILVSAVAAATCGESAHLAFSRVAAGATRAPILLVVALAAAGGMTSRAALGYLSPGSYAEEVLAARSFLAARHLYQGDDRQDFSRWMSEEPAPISPWALPGLSVCEANAVSSRPEFYTAQGHSPLLLMFSVPVVALGGGRSLYWIFVGLSIGSLLAIAVALGRSYELPLKSPGGVLLVAVLLGWQPALAGIRQGDAVIFVAGLIVAAWSAVGRAGPARGGFMTGLAGSLLVSTAVLLVPVGLRSKRAMAAALAVLLLALGATLAAGGPLIVADYVRSTTASGRLYNAAPMSYAMTGQFFRIGSGDAGAALRAALVLLAASLLCAWRLRGAVSGQLEATERSGASPFDLLMALFTGLAFLLLPVAWSQHVALLIIPIAVLLRRAIALERPWRLAVLALLVLLLSLPDQAVGRLGLALHLSGGSEGITGLPPVPVWAATAIWLWLLTVCLGVPAKIGYSLNGRPPGGEPQLSA